MNKKLSTIIGIVAVIAVVLIAINFGGQQKPQDIKHIKIGVIAPLSGDLAAVGENAVKGMKAAQSVYNEKRGSNDPQIDLVIEDDAFDSKKGVSAYEKLTTIDHVDGLINCSTPTMDAIYDSTKGKYPVMMMFFQANNVADDHIFQMTPGNDGTWPKYAQYIKGNTSYDKSKFVVVHSNDAGQIAFAKAFTEAYGDTVTDYTVSSKTLDLKSDAAKIKGLNPTSIIFFMLPETGAVLTKNLQQILPADQKVSFIYDTQLMTGIATYKKILGDLSKIEGSITLVPEGKPNADFSSSYMKVNGEAPGFISDFGYDGFMVYAKTYSSDNSKWTANLRGYNENGASGQVQFDDKGVRKPDLVIKKMIGSELQTVERLPF